MIKREINLDHDRTRRIGFAEAVYSASKSVDQLAEILNQSAQREITLLLTRLTPAQFDALPLEYRAALDYDPVSQTAFFGQMKLPSNGAEIAVITAGTSDVPVALEAASDAELLVLGIFEDFILSMKSSPCLIYN